MLVYRILSAQAVVISRAMDHSHSIRDAKMENIYTGTDINTSVCFNEFPITVLQGMVLYWIRRPCVGHFLSTAVVSLPVIKDSNKHTPKSLHQWIMRVSDWSTIDKGITTSSHSEFKMGNLSVRGAKEPGMMYFPTWVAIIKGESLELPPNQQESPPGPNQQQSPPGLFCL